MEPMIRLQELLIPVIQVSILIDQLSIVGTSVLLIPVTFINICIDLGTYITILYQSAPIGDVERCYTSLVTSYYITSLSISPEKLLIHQTLAFCDFQRLHIYKYLVVSQAVIWAPTKNLLKALLTSLSDKIASYEWKVH